MEIGELKPQTRDVELLHPKTGEPIGVRVSVLSIEDEALKSVKRQILNGKLTAEQKGKHLKADDIEGNLDAILLAAVKEWCWYNPTDNDDNHPTLDGERSPELNPRNLKKLLAVESLRAQVNEAISDTQAFY